VSRTLNPIEEAERAGFDLSLIDESLSYSYEQRALYHQAALNLVLEMESAGRRIGDRHQPTTNEPQPPKTAIIGVTTAPSCKPALNIDQRF
jgi:hypothetical protein